MHRNNFSVKNYFISKVIKEKLYFYISYRDKVIIYKVKIIHAKEDIAD